MKSPPLTPLRRFDTHRLLPAKYGTNLDSVLTRLVGNESAPDDLAHIFELDNATNARLLAEDGRSLDITARELVYRVPQAHIINAAFTHPNPLGARFSTPGRGAWYAAFEIATCKSEVLFHKQIEYAEIDWNEREEILYDDYLADFTGTFHDLRPEALSQLVSPTEGTLRIQASLASQFEDGGEPAQERALSTAHDFAECLSPTSYVASQTLAALLLNQGSLGILYPSVRRPGGTCIACFRPSVVANVRKGYRYKLTWTPSRATFVRC
jgi:RES domain-containing protein